MSRYLVRCPETRPTEQVREQLDQSDHCEVTQSLAHATSQTSTWVGLGSLHRRDDTTIWTDSKHLYSSYSSFICILRICIRQPIAACFGGGSPPKLFPLGPGIPYLTRYYVSSDAHCKMASRSMKRFKCDKQTNYATEKCVARATALQTLGWLVGDRKTTSIHEINK